MANYRYQVGETYGNFKILKKLKDKKYTKLQFEVLNILSNKKKIMTSSAIYLAELRKSKRDLKGRPRKWIYKVDKNGFIISKIRYIDPYLKIK